MDAPGKRDGIPLGGPGYSGPALLHFVITYLSALLFPRKGSIIVIQRVRSGFIHSAALKMLVVLRRGLTVPRY